MITHGPHILCHLNALAISEFGHGNYHVCVRPEGASVFSAAVVVDESSLDNTEATARSRREADISRRLDALIHLEMPQRVRVVLRLFTMAEFAEAGEERWYELEHEER